MTSCATYKNSISSNLVDLDVFPKLTVYPPKILIAPNCKTSFRMIGGPSQKSRRTYGIKLKFREINKSNLLNIENVESDFYLLHSLPGNDRGKNTVIFQFVRNTSNSLDNSGFEEVLAEANLVVDVEKMDSIDLSGKITFL